MASAWKKWAASPFGFLSVEIRLGGQSPGSTVKKPRTNSVRILLVDDHEVLRRGLRELLESQSGWQVCGEASTGRDAVEKVRQLDPDVVVMDIAMPGLNGLEATRQIVRSGSRSQVLIFSMYGSEQLMRDVY